jgi:hypothetical protein
MGILEQFANYKVKNSPSYRGGANNETDHAVREAVFLY